MRPLKDEKVFFFKFFFSVSQIVTSVASNISGRMNKVFLTIPYDPRPYRSVATSWGFTHLYTALDRSGGPLRSNSLIRSRPGSLPVVDGRIIAGTSKVFLRYRKRVSRDTAPAPCDATCVKTPHAAQHATLSRMRPQGSVSTAIKLPSSSLKGPFHRAWYWPTPLPMTKKQPVSSPDGAKKKDWQHCMHTYFEQCKRDRPIMQLDSRTCIWAKVMEDFSTNLMNKAMCVRASFNERSWPVQVPFIYM